LIETLVQQARSYVYTTAAPPAMAAAPRAALRLVAEGEDLRERLQASIARFRQGAAQLGLPCDRSTGGDDSPIQPLLLGSSVSAVRAAQALLERGLLVTAIRPPTVPEGTARLRVTLSAAHTGEQVDRLLDGLDDVLRSRDD
jgi:8-amino-7-oxononanoate synthase